MKRFLYVSHLGADRMSAFAVHKAKGIAEEHIRRSGVPYTILRSSIVYGPEDHFTRAADARPARGARASAPARAADGRSSSRCGSKTW